MNIDERCAENARVAFFTAKVYYYSGKTPYTAVVNINRLDRIIDRANRIIRDRSLEQAVKTIANDPACIAAKAKLDAGTHILCPNCVALTLATSPCHNCGRSAL